MRKTILSLAMFVISSTQALEASPVISAVNVPSSARIMTEVELAVSAESDDAERGLSYKWSILQNPTGAAAIPDPNHARARLQIWWSSADTAAHHIGEVLRVRVEVNYVDASPQEMPASEEADVVLSGLNHPPVAVISGQVGTPSNRLLPGTVVQMDGFQSTDVDGDIFSYRWQRGEKSGGTYLQQLVLYGSDSAVAAFVVPEITGNIDQIFSLEIIDGLHTASTSATVYMSPSSGQPEPSPLQFDEIPDSVDSGSRFMVSASYSGAGDELQFNWSAKDVFDNPVTVCACSGATSALVTAPQLLEGEEVRQFTVSVSVVDDGSMVGPISATVEVHRPMLYFSQVAVGRVDARRRFETSVALVNANDSPVNAAAVFWNNETGADWSVTVDGERVSQVSLTLPPGGTRILNLSGEDIEIGWMALTSSAPLTGHLFYRVIDSEEGTISEVPILPNTASRFRTALAPGANRDVALALVDVEGSPVTFRVSVTQFPSGEGAGQLVVATDEITLEAKEHLALFLDEFLIRYSKSKVALPDSFQGGALSIEVVTGGQLSATVITTRRGLPLSILPVATD